MSDSEIKTRPAPTAEEVDKMFPQYEVSMHVGLGSMGAVYYALKDGEACAIKLLLGVDCPAQEKEFHCEAEAMSVMDHPYILKLHDYGEVDGFKFIILDYVSRGTLHEVAQEFKFDQYSVASMAVMLCQALGYSHGLGYVHRDIKPDNIMIADDWTPRIMDFGLAVDSNDVDYEYKAVGSLGYAAPEVLEAPETVDHRVDIYALGGVIYNMLTGVIPDAKEVDFSKLQGCDPRLKVLIKNAMQRDPAKRTESTEAMEKRLMSMMKSWQLQKDENAT